MEAQTKVPSSALEASKYYYAHHTGSANREAPAPEAPPQRINDACEVAEVDTSISQSKWNANSYHWEERNYSKWFGEELRKAVFAQKVNVKKGSVTFTSLKVAGEAYSNVRKGKKIVGYDLQFEVYWTCILQDRTGGTTEARGTFLIEGVSEDNTPEEYTVSKAKLEKATPPRAGMTTIELDRMIRTRKIACKYIDKTAKSVFLTHLASTIKSLYEK